MTDIMSHECEMGFLDLFIRAKKRAWTPEEEAAFASLDQETRNAAVRQLALEAEGIHTEDRIGADGLVYTAFWAESRPGSADA